MDLASLKLMLQPLVENAIYHGMEFMDGDGEIRDPGVARGRGSVPERVRQWTWHDRWNRWSVCSTDSRPCCLPAEVPGSA